MIDQHNVWRNRTVPDVRTPGPISALCVPKEEIQWTLATHNRGNALVVQHCGCYAPWMWCLRSSTTDHFFWRENITDKNHASEQNHFPVYHSFIKVPCIWQISGKRYMNNVDREISSYNFCSGISDLFISVTSKMHHDSHNRLKTSDIPINNDLQSSVLEWPDR